jgi:hypothetical protein
MTLVATLLLVGHALPLAASDLTRPLYQGQVAVITSPESSSTVQGNVPIIGSALHPQFQRYELYYTVEPGENWVFIGEAHFEPVDNGILATWNASSLPEGTYSLRLRVVRLDGNYDEAYQRDINIGSAAPTVTPTEFVAPTLPLPAEPTVTATLEATPTPISVEQPEIPTPTPRPSATPTDEPEAPVVDQIDDDSGFFSQSLNVDSLRDSFATGLAYAGAVFLGVGAFFGVKRLLTWLWYLIAP